MKTIKLTSDQWRAWRQDRHDLVVDAEKTFLREHTEGEELAEGESLCSAREIIKAQLRKENGGLDCRIMNPQSRFVASSRNSAPPGTGRAQSFLGGSALAPEVCQCAGWANRPQGQHHSICQNRIAWETHKRNQIATKIVPAPGSAKAQHMPAATARAPRVTANPIPAVKPNITRSALPAKASVPAQLGPAVPAPAGCVCQAWLAPPRTEGQHNPICEHFEAWQKTHPPAARAAESQLMLFSPEGEALRPASTEEIAQANAATEATGAPSVQIDGQEFMVAASAGAAE